MKAKIFDEAWLREYQSRQSPTSTSKRGSVSPDTKPEEQEIARPAKPGVRLKSSEHKEQVKLFKWRRENIKFYPYLAALYAVPNGGKRHLHAAAKFKREGVTSGVFDLHLPCPIAGYCGLWIEMKYMYNKLSQEQREWADLMRWLGHRCEVCYSFEEARWVLLDYLTDSGKQLRQAA